MKNSKMYGMLFREKPANMLLEMHLATQQTYASELAKRVDCTYSHVVKVLDMMMKSGLVTFEKYGRLKLLKLTEKGTKVAEHIRLIKEVM